MTNSFDSVYPVVIFDSMKDAIGILIAGLFIGLGVSVTATGAWSVASGVKILIQILK